MLYRIKKLHWFIDPSCPNMYSTRVIDSVVTVIQDPESKKWYFLKGNYGLFNTAQKAKEAFQKDWEKKMRAFLQRNRVRKSKTNTWAETAAIGRRVAERGERLLKKKGLIIEERRIMYCPKAQSNKCSDTNCWHFGKHIETFNIDNGCSTCMEQGSPIVCPKCRPVKGKNK